MKLKTFYLFSLLLLITNLETPARANSFYDFKSGEKLIYSFRYRCESSYDFGRIFKTSEGNPLIIPGAIGDLRTIVSGEVFFLPFIDKEDAVILYCKLKLNYFYFELNHLHPHEDELTIKRDMEKPFYIAFAKSGKILYLEIEDSVCGVADGYIRTLLSFFQIVSPESFREECWQTEETDPSGIYKATYKKLVGGKDTISFIKSKISYKSAEKADEEPKLNPKIVPKGEIRIEYAFRVGKPISLKGNDELEIFIVDRKVGNIKTDVILNLISIENISEAETSALQNVYIERKTLLRKLPLYQKLSGGEETIYRKILGDTKLDNLLGELSEIEQGETKDSLSLYLKLKAFIYLHPDDCEKIEEILLNSKELKPSQKLILEALSAVGNSQAQEILLRFVRTNRKNPSILLPVIYSLADIKRPIPAIVDELSQLAFNEEDFEIPSTAQLVLGIMANRLRDSSNEISEKIVDKFIDRLNSSSSIRETTLLLLCLGNAGLNRSFPILLKFSEEESPEIRATALWAMRFIWTKEAEDVLLKAILSDPQPSVRLQAALSLSFRKMSSSSYQIHKKVLLKSDDELLRIQLLKNLWNGRESFPEIIGLIKKLAREDKQAKIRETAKSLLAEEKYR